MVQGDHFAHSKIQLMANFVSFFGIHWFSFNFFLRNLGTIGMSVNYKTYESEIKENMWHVERKNASLLKYNSSLTAGCKNTDENGTRFSTFPKGHLSLQEFEDSSSLSFKCNSPDEKHSENADRQNEKCCQNEITPCCFGWDFKFNWKFRIWHLLHLIWYIRSTNISFYVFNNKFII